MTIYKLGVSSFAIALWVSLAGVPAANANISSQPNPIEDRFGSSEYVCICEVVQTIQTPLSNTEGRNLALTGYTSKIRFDQVLKGTPNIQEGTVVFSNVDPLMGPPLLASSHYLMFLKRISQSHFRLTDNAGAVPISTQVVIRSNSNGLRSLESGIAHALINQSNDADTIGLLEVLLQFRKLSDTTIADLDTLSYRPQSRVAILSLTALCRESTSRSKYVTRLMDALVDFDTNYPAELQILGPELSRIGDIIAEDTATTDLVALERLTKSQTNVLRLCAMLGIRRLRSSDTVPFLISTLESSDRQVQFEAIVALSEITGQKGDFGPGKGLFDENPSRFIRIWKDWYVHQGKAPESSTETKPH